MRARAGERRAERERGLGGAGLMRACAAAASRYSTAIAILKKNPKAAAAPMPGECTGSPWLALHVVLTQDSGKGLGADVKAAAAAARRLAAEPLIQALLRAYAPAAAMRTMEGVRFPDGHLPLELAITRGWPASVCKMVRSRRERRRRFSGGMMKLRRHLGRSPCLSGFRREQGRADDARPGHAQEGARAAEGDADDDQGLPLDA